MSAPLILMTKRLFLSLILASSSGAAEWEALPVLPAPNGGGLCGVVGRKIVVVGGTNWEGGTKNWLRTVHEFDPATQRWSLVKELEEGPVAYGVGLQEGGAFSILGGSDGKQAVKAIAKIEGTKSKLQAVPELPASVVLAAGGVVDGTFIVAGGTDDAANVAGVCRTTHAVTSSDGNWRVRRLADFPGKAFISAAAAVAGNELFVFGGLNWDEAAQGIQNTSAAHAFSPGRNTWRTLKPLGAAARGLTAVALDGRHIYLAGGYTDNFSSEAFIYDVQSNSYRPAKPLPYAAMVALVKCEGFIYCLGGEDKKQSRTDKFFRIPVAELLK